MWTIVPDEVLWEGFDEDNRRYVEITNKAGILLQVELIGLTRGRVVRVISSEPTDYWRPDCQPGVVVELMAGEPVPDESFFHSPQMVAL